MNIVLFFALSLLSFSSLAMEPAEQPRKDICPFSEDLDKGQFDPFTIFLIGESHGTRDNYTVQLELAKYFNRTQDVRHIFLEYGFGTGELLNLYLKTGNTTCIDEVFKSLKGTPSYSQDFYKFIQEIYLYNQTLPEDQTMKFVGVDIEHWPLTGLNYLSLLLPNSSPPEEISGDIDWLRQSPNLIFENTFTSFFINKLINEIRAFLNNFAQNIKAYQSYLGNNFPSFCRTVEGIEQGTTCHALDKYDYAVERESCIKKNFCDALDIEKPLKCMSIFGSFHTILDRTAFQETVLFEHGRDIMDHNMAIFLNEHLQTAGKVALIDLCYHNCRILEDGQQKPITIGTGFDDFAAKMPNDIQFYSSVGDKGQVFALVIKNSPPVIPFAAKEEEKSLPMDEEPLCTIF